MRCESEVNLSVVFDASHVGEGVLSTCLSFLNMIVKLSVERRGSGKEWLVGRRHEGKEVKR